MYVADKNNNRIDVFDTNGKYIESWGSLGQERDSLTILPIWPTDFSRGLIFVSDIGNNRVEKFDTNGKFLGMWGSTGRRPRSIRPYRGLISGYSGEVHIRQRYSEIIESRNLTIMANLSSHGGPTVQLEASLTGLQA